MTEHLARLRRGVLVSALAAGLLLAGSAAASAGGVDGAPSAPLTPVVVITMAPPVTCDALPGPDEPACALRDEAPADVDTTAAPADR